MRSFLFAFVALLFSTSLSLSFDIVVNEVDTRFMDKFTEGSKGNASSMLRNKTALVKVKGFPRSAQSVVPFSGVVVMYFKSNGDVLTWSGKSKKVEKGKWRLQGRQNNICFFFPQGNGAGACTNFFITYDFLEEVTKGNPFGLKAGAAVPYKLGRFGVSLSKVAKKLD